jgi:uncharacterized membrane protein YfcA
VLSAAGGLAGALLYTRFSNRALTLTLGFLLIATAIAGITDWLRRFRLGRTAAGLLGFASGLFGGVAGNQGGLRAGALLAFALTPAAFVATSTAVGLMVDAARMPIYVLRAGGTLRPFVALIAVATFGVLIGTVWGEHVLLRMSVDRYRKVVSVLIGLLGIWLISGVL